MTTASFGRVEDWRASLRVRWLYRRFRSGPQSGSRNRVSSPRSSVGSGTGAPILRVRWLFHCFRSGPQSGSRNHVSSSRLVKRSMRFSRTALSCCLDPGLCGLLTGERFQRQIVDPVLREQSEPLIKPPPTPPLPAKSSTSALLHQVSPYLLLDPILDVTEASTRHSYAKIVHPSTQDRVDQVHDPLDRLRAVAPEDFLESTQEFGACLHCRHIADPHLPRRVFTRRISNPRKLKLSPLARSTRRVLSRLSSTPSLASSSRSLLYAAFSSHRHRR